jgi:hypothetical protein
MITTSHNPQLPRGSIGFALGIAGMLVSLYFSIMFIAGNATGAELVAGIVFCLILDYGKVALATEALLAMASFRLLSAVCYALIVLCLYGLSMLAATFMLTSHTNSAAADQSDKQIATLQQAISDKQQQLSACNQNYLSKCVNPRTKELNELQAQLTTAQAGISKDVIEAKDRAATWEKLAKAVESTPEQLQVKLAFTRAVLLEIIAPIFVSLFLSRYRNSKTEQEPERVINETPPYNAPVSTDTSRLIEEQRQTIERLQAQLPNGENHPKKTPH